MKPTITIIFRIQITFGKVIDGDREQSYEHVDGLVFDKNIHRDLTFKESIVNAQKEEQTTKLGSLEFVDEKTEGLLGQDEM